MRSLLLAKFFGGLFEMGPRCRIRAGADQGAPRLRMDQVALQWTVT